MDTTLVDWIVAWHNDYFSSNATGAGAGSGKMKGEPKCGRGPNIVGVGWI
jgi:hypothetical protein